MLSSTDVLLGNPATFWEKFGLVLKIIAAILFVIWLGLVLLGKGGFVHVLLLNAVGVAAVEAVTMYRTRMRT